METAVLLLSTFETSFAPTTLAVLLVHCGRQILTARLVFGLTNSRTGR